MGLGSKNSDLFANKLILAPMVRVGQLPMRLLALDYGADLVYTEELIDWKLLRSVRRENTILGTVDFLDPTDGCIVFRTCSQEKDRLVLQLGTSDPERALRAAKLVENEVSAIDVNMGCPKSFSLKGGMGAALLYEPEKAKAILRKLVENCKVPISCKIRVLPDVEATVELAKSLESTGISAIAVHGRTKEERPQHECRLEYIKAVAEALTIPVIANGGSREMNSRQDALKFRAQCGTSSVMIARAAEWNCSIFRNDGMLPLDDVIKAFLRLSIEYDNAASNTKYCVQNMLRELQETPRGKLFLESQTAEQICEIWDLGDLCRTKQLEQLRRGNLDRRDIVEDKVEEDTKRFKLDDSIIGHKIIFLRNSFQHDHDLPKHRLYLHARKNFKKTPNYETITKQKLFRSVLTFDERQYTSLYWEKNKKFADQGAALCCLLSLGVYSREELLKNRSLLE